MPPNIPLNQDTRAPETPARSSLTTDRAGRRMPAVEILDSGQRGCADRSEVAKGALHPPGFQGSEDAGPLPPDRRGVALAGVRHLSPQRASKRAPQRAPKRAPQRAPKRPGAGATDGPRAGAGALERGAILQLGGRRCP